MTTSPLFVCGNTLKVALVQCGVHIGFFHLRLFPCLFLFFLGATIILVTMGLCSQLLHLEAMAVVL